MKYHRVTQTLESVPGGGNYRRLCLFLFCLAAICAAAAYIGAVPIRKFGHDIFFLLDNGWRVVNGQRPHLDFTSPWGPLSFLVVGAGLVSSQNSADAIGYGAAIFAFVAAVWGYCLCRNSIAFLPRLVVSLYLALLVVSPYSLGWGPLNSSHAMFYNRYGYALLGLLMIEAFRPDGAACGERGEWIGGLSTGAVAALALFLKANYFAAALLLITASLLLGRRSKGRLAGMAVGFSLVTLAFLSYLRFDLAAIAGDLELAAGARSRSFRVAELVRKLAINAPSLLFVVLLSLASSVTRRVSGLSLGVFVFAVDMLLLCSNQQYSELPLTALFAFFLAVEAPASHLKSRGGCQKDMPRRVRLAVLAGVSFFLVSFCTQFYGLAYGFLQEMRPSKPDSLERFAEPRLRSLLLYDDEAEPKSNGKYYVRYVNSGMRLLRQNSGPTDTVLTMDMMNPFPYALGRMPPRGGIAAAAYDYTLSDSHRPSDERFFGDADVVMVPKHPASSRVMYLGLLRIYQAGLDSRFRLAAESDMWFLYRRR